MTCAGVLDAVAAVLGRAAPDAPLGLWLLHANEVLRAISIGALLILLRQWGASWLIAAAVAVAIALSPAAAVTYSPLEPAAWLVAIVTCIALRRHSGKRWSPGPSGPGFAILSGLLLLALISPRAALLFAAIAAWLALAADSGPKALRGWRRALTAAATIAILALLGREAFPDLPPSAALETGCAPFPWRSDIRTWISGLKAAVGSTGLYGAGLAALGAFALSRRDDVWRGRAAQRTSIGWAVLIFAFAPAAAAVLIALGLKEIVASAGRRVGGQVAAGLLIALLPLLSYASFTRQPAPNPTWSVETLSSGDLRQLLGLLPDNSVLVDEDVSTAALLRSLDGSWQRMGKRLRRVPRDPEALSGVLADTGARVFALPGAQTELQWLGFTLAAARLPGATGIAAVNAAGECRLATGQWTALPSIATSGATVLSFVTRDFGTPHAVVVYLSLSQGRQPAVIETIAPGRVGFQADTYTRANADDEARLGELLKADGVPVPLAEPLGPVVARLEIWREAGLPEILPVDLSGTPALLLVRGQSNNTSDRICPAFPYKAEAVQIQR